jgi:hypothetical protein
VSQQGWKWQGLLAPMNMELRSLLSMDALSGWRDVRRTVRNNTDDVSDRFFMRE